MRSNKCCQKLWYTNIGLIADRWWSDLAWLNWLKNLPEDRQASAWKQSHFLVDIINILYFNLSLIDEVPWSSFELSTDTKYISKQWKQSIDSLAKLTSRFTSNHYKIRTWQVDKNKIDPCKSACANLGHCRQNAVAPIGLGALCAIDSFNHVLKKWFLWREIKGLW